MDADDFLLPGHERELIESPSRRELRAMLGFVAFFCVLLLGFEVTTPEPFLRVMGCLFLVSGAAGTALGALLQKVRSKYGTASPPWPPIAMVFVVYLGSCAMPIGVLGYWGIDWVWKNSTLASDSGAWMLHPLAAFVMVLLPPVEVLHRAWLLKYAKRRRALELQPTDDKRVDDQVRQLERLASQDALTGLPNRRAFESALQHLASGTEEYAVMFFDFDRFKPINDQYGHATGDAFLKAIASRLKSLMRATDFVARLGGDEFAVIVAGSAAQTISTQLADRFAELMQEPVECGSASVRSSASIGISVAKPGQTAPEVLVHQADLAMYEAKRAGGARYCVAGPIPVATM